MSLRLAGSCWTKFETGQTSESTIANISIVSRSSKRGLTMLRSFAQHIQQCCAGARALHATYPHKCMRTKNKNGVGDGKCPRVLCFLIERPNMLRLVASVCTHRLTSRNKGQHCWSQQYDVLLRAFALAFRIASCFKGFARTSLLSIAVIAVISGFDK